MENSTRTTREQEEIYRKSDVKTANAESTPDKEN
jgi:hypothetical protein